MNLSNRIKPTNDMNTQVNADKAINYIVIGMHDSLPFNALILSFDIWVSSPIDRQRAYS